MMVWKTKFRLPICNISPLLLPAQMYRKKLNNVWEPVVEMQFLSLLHTVYLNSTQIIMLQSKSFKMHISNEEKKN